MISKLLRKLGPGLEVGIDQVNANVAHVIANDGTLLPIDSLKQTLIYNPDTTLNYIEVFLNGYFYRQTFSNYTAGKPGLISQWERQ